MHYTTSATLFVALLSAFTQALPTRSATTEDFGIQHHIVDPNYRNLTALPGWAPPATIGKRQFGDSGVDPSMATGKIQWDTGIAAAYCTGALVGPRHILTSRKCAVSHGSSPAMFNPAFDNNNHDNDEGVSKFGATTIIKTYNIEQGTGFCEASQNFAVMVLGARLGDEAGWFGVVTPDSDHYDQPIFSTYGYRLIGKFNNYEWDRAKTPVAFSGITLTNPIEDGRPQLGCDDTGPLYTKSETPTPGSPLYDDRLMIWGVQGETEFSETNNGVPVVVRWASGEKMISTINKALAENP